MEPQRRVKDVLANGGDWIDVRGHKKHIKGYLKEFLFDPAIVDMKVGVLSGGERSRLLLAREFARAANLLVLDEPTNDLDLETLDLLQEVIADYEGTVLIVSHDRDFLDRTVTITLGLDGSGKVDIVAGGYEDWVRKRYEAKAPSRNEEGGRRAKRDGGRGVQGSNAPPSALGAATSAPAGRCKLSYKDQRDYDRLPDEIERLQRAVAADEAALSDPDLYNRDPSRFAELTERIARHRADIEAAELRWLEVAEMAEQLARSLRTFAIRYNLP
jgi:ATP-binding cassette subfamily F protein uup